MLENNYADPAYYYKRLFYNIYIYFIIKLHLYGKDEFFFTIVVVSFLSKFEHLNITCHFVVK